MEMIEVKEILSITKEKRKEPWRREVSRFGILEQEGLEVLETQNDHQANGNPIRFPKVIYPNPINFSLLSTLEPLGRSGIYSCTFSSLDR